MAEECAAGDGGDAVAAVDPAASRLVYPTILAHDAVAGALARHTEVCADLPVASIQRFARDVVVKKCPAASWVSKGRPEGAVITELSHQSRMRYLHTAKNCGIEWKSLPTLTYPKEFPRDGRRVKRDRKTISEWFKNNFHGCHGMWQMEFQQRGAPHFHDLSDIDLASYGQLVRKKRSRPAKGAASEYYWTCLEMERALAEAWFRIVGSADPNHLKAGVSWEVCDCSDGAIRYAAMHSAKPHQKTVPDDYVDIGRFWGKYGGVRVVAFDPEPATAETIFAEFGPDAMSSKGRVKKYLWDACQSECW